MKFLNKLCLISWLIAVAAIITLGCGSSSSSTSTSSSSSRTAPDFTVTTLSGTTVNFNSDLKGKPVLLNFAASWCGPCEIEAPVLAKAYQTYKDKVQFFGLAVRDTEEDQRAFAQKHGLEFPIGQDPDGKIVYLYQKAGKVNLSGIPTTFFIDKDGNIAGYFIGPLSEKTLEQKIATIIPIEEPGISTPTTPTAPITPSPTTLTTPGPIAPTPPTTQTAPTPPSTPTGGKTSSPETGAPITSIIALGSGLLGVGISLYRRQRKVS